MSGRGYYKVRDVGTLNAAQAELITACGGPLEAAKKCGVGKSVLQAASDPDQNKRFLSTKTVMELEAACGQPIVTRFLAGERACIVEPVKCHSRRPLAMVMGSITSETGELLSAAAKDVAAGSLTVANASLIIDETDDLLCAVVELRVACRDKLESEAA
jgi:hypothetical protein